MKNVIALLVFAGFLATIGVFGVGCDSSKPATKSTSTGASGTASGTTKSTEKEP